MELVGRVSAGSPTGARPRLWRPRLHRRGRRRNAWTTGSRRRACNAAFRHCRAQTSCSWRDSRRRRQISLGLLTAAACETGATAAPSATAAMSAPRYFRTNTLGDATIIYFVPLRGPIRPLGDTLLPKARVRCCYQGNGTKRDLTPLVTNDRSLLIAARYVTSPPSPRYGNRRVNDREARAAPAKRQRRQPQRQAPVSESPVEE